MKSCEEKNSQKAFLQGRRELYKSPRGSERTSGKKGTARTGVCFELLAVSTGETDLTSIKKKLKERKRIRGQAQARRATFRRFDLKRAQKEGPFSSVTKCEGRGGG